MESISNKADQMGERMSDLENKNIQMTEKGTQIKKKIKKAYERY